MKSYSSKEIIKLLTADGWYEVRVDGSHHHFRHDVKKGTVTVPHPKKDFAPKTMRSIFTQAGIDV